MKENYENSEIRNLEYNKNGYDPCKKHCHDDDDDCTVYIVIIIVLLVLLTRDDEAAAGGLGGNGLIEEISSIWKALKELK